MSQAGYNLHVYVPLDAFQDNEDRFLGWKRQVQWNHFPL